jgi:hypothetical protein
MSPSNPISHQEINALTGILARRAFRAPLNIGPLGYYRSLILKTNVPQSWQSQRAGGLVGDPEFDARELANWAAEQGTNPADARFTVLGSLLSNVINDVGLEDARFLAALILARGLYHDPRLQEALRLRYKVPVHAELAGAPVEEFGPEIEWFGPTESVELQFWTRPKPDLQDVGFLKRAIERAASVCRIEFGQLPRRGTGFLIAGNLVLTNYHVLMGASGEDLLENAGDLTLHFGKITAPDGEETMGQSFKLVGDQPVLKSSPVGQLDYALLQADPAILGAQEISPAPLSDETPLKGMGLNILQHPGGEALKLALSGDGVESVFPEKGLVQYSTRALGGSSGAPCFNDDWQVVALHHAQRSRSFGTIREGILIRSILPEIEQFLQ